jgi:GNAT superfamily N-acetyltransferase
MTDDVALSIRQFTRAWQIMCAPSAKYSAAAADGVEYVFAGCPVAFFNVALVTAPEIDADALTAHAQRASAWAADKAVPWMFAITHETLGSGVDAASVLDAAGFAPLMPLTGMVSHHITAATRVPNGIELIVPNDDEGCRSVVDVNALAYDADLETTKDIIGRQSFWRDHFAVLATADGKPASCAAVLMVDGHRYVALVATDPAQQRRGYAEAAMRRALEIAARVHGEQPTVLHATEAGRPIYERMGYRLVANHTLFMEKRLLTGH